MRSLATPASVKMPVTASAMPCRKTRARPRTSQEVMAPGCAQNKLHTLTKMTRCPYSSDGVAIEALTGKGEGDTDADV
jgi:hypothetical protein